MTSKYWLGNINVIPGIGTVTVSFPSIYYDNSASPIVQIDWGDSVTNATATGPRPIWRVNNVTRNYLDGSYQITITLKDRCGYSESSNFPFQVVTPLVTTSRTPVVTTSVQNINIESEKSSDTAPESKTSSTIIVVVSATLSLLVVIVIAIVVILIIVMRKHKGEKEQSAKYEFRALAPHPPPPLMESLQEVMTDFGDIKFGKILGKGNFGVVYK